MNDPIADMLIRIKNAYLARLSNVEVPYSKQAEALGRLLQSHALVESIEIKGEKIKVMVLKLLYTNKQPAISHVERISKSSKRVYVGKHKIPRILGGLGIAVLSTTQGLMIDKEARQKGLGGEIICTVW